MLITKNFIILNNPKTGSTFVRTVIKKIHKKRTSKNVLTLLKQKLHWSEPELIELILPNIKVNGRSPDQHGTYSQIPKKYLDRKVLSIVRNPYDRFLSTFEFKFWANNLTKEKKNIKKQFPSFPNINLDEYVDLQLLLEKKRLGTIVNYQEIGSQTIQFIQMFFKNPTTVLTKINKQYIESGQYKDDMGNISFIRQENLNLEFTKFLAHFNYTDEELNLVKNFKKVNLTKEGSTKRKNLWTEKAMQYIQKRERFLFKILQDFGVEYHPPFTL